MLTIYHNDTSMEQLVEHEQVALTDYNDRGLPALHQLMVDKGFTRKSEEEIKTLRETFAAQKLAKELENQARIEYFRKKAGMDETFKPAIKSKITAVNGKKLDEPIPVETLPKVDANGEAAVNTEPEPAPTLTSMNDEL